MVFCKRRSFVEVHKSIRKKYFVALKPIQKFPNWLFCHFLPLIPTHHIASIKYWHQSDLPWKLCPSSQGNSSLSCFFYTPVQYQPLNIPQTQPEIWIWKIKLNFFVNCAPPHMEAPLREEGWELPTEAQRHRGTEAQRQAHAPPLLHNQLPCSAMAMMGSGSKAIVNILAHQRGSANQETVDENDTW